MRVFDQRLPTRTPRTFIQVPGRRLQMRVLTLKPVRPEHTDGGFSERRRDIFAAKLGGLDRVGERIRISFALKPAFAGEPSLGSPVLNSGTEPPRGW